MLIVFGTRFCGKIASVNNQWIESKFFSVMFVPIFPVGSMFVTGSEFRSRKGFSMGINAQSVKAVYGRLFSLIFAAWFLFLAYAGSGGYGPNRFSGTLLNLFLGILFTLLCLYFYFYYAKATPEDVVLRNKVGHITGYYALPHWFDYYVLKNTFEKLQAQYQKAFPGSNWKGDLQGQGFDNDRCKLLFGLALFNYMVFDMPENDELYALADRLYILKPDTTLYKTIAKSSITLEKTINEDVCQLFRMFQLKPAPTLAFRNGRYNRKGVFEGNPDVLLQRSRSHRQVQLLLLFFPATCPKLPFRQ